MIRKIRPRPCSNCRSSPPTRDTIARMSAITPTTIVFDFGGVLLDWNPRYLYRKLFPGDEPGMERYLVETGFFEWNHRQDARLPFSAGVAEQCSRYPHYCHLVRAYAERFPETVSGPIQGTVEILRRLHLAGWPLFGLSNWAADTFYQVRPNFAFLDWFQSIVLSGEVGIAKPDPRIFQVLLERTGRQAGDCLLIDDAPANIAAAAALGFQTVRFESPQQLKDALVRRGLLAPNGYLPRDR